MLGRLPSEVFLQITDHLHPSDMATLSSFGELAHLFHYIHDTDQERTATSAYFMPHPRVRSDLLYSNIPVDTSRYYLVEVKGAQSLVVAEDKTRTTRRTICMTNNLDSVSLNFKSIREDSDSRQKYVFINFPTVMLTNEALFDPKSIEIYNTASLSLAFINSSDYGAALKVYGVKDMLISSASSFIDNVDLQNVPTGRLTMFVKDVSLRDIRAQSCKEVILYHPIELQECEFQSAERLSITTEPKSLIHRLNLPNTEMLMLYFNEHKPQVKTLYAPHLTGLKLEDMSMDAAAPVTDEPYDLLANPLLYANITRCRVSTWLGGRRVLQHLPMARNLVHLQIDVNQVLDNNFTRSLSLPCLKRLDIHGLGGEVIPEFHLPSLEELTIVCDTLVSLLPSDIRLSECFQNLRTLSLDSCGIAAAQSLFGGQVFHHLESLKLIYLTLNDTNNVVDFDQAQFPRLKHMEIDLHINTEQTVRLYSSFCPLLEKLICAVNNDDEHPDGRVFHAQALEIVNCVSLRMLVVMGVSGVSLFNCPAFEELYHGGIRELERFECDATVTHLKTLVYHNKDSRVPIQSATHVCPGVARKCIASQVHPRAGDFTQALVLEFIDD